MLADRRGHAVTAELPMSRGPLSAALIEALEDDRRLDLPSGVDSVDPYGDDLQLALYVAFEMHYAGWAGIDDDREWDHDIIAYRRELERHFLDAVRADVGPVDEFSSAQIEMNRLCVEPADGDGVSFILRDSGSWRQFRDMFAMRSLYHLKEADPHAWAIPRLRGAAKAAFVAVEFDEFGGGHGEAVHQELFADLLAAADLRPDYLAYLEGAAGWVLAPVNLMSLFGLRRSMRGAAVGHLAATEITSPPGSQRLLSGLERLDAPEPCRHFYAEHVEADAVHEQILRNDVVGELVRDEPHLETDVVFGIRGFLLVEDAFDRGLRSVWEQGALLV
ncbi:iron-containing redox enzyme family protein [Gordonia hankookensis]|uniref:Iron-containing redox enzyme family protein n=1 Tax=Gordonia hankookensis TaxID=589403 RepID=A0ABR7WIH0_9ACTN|nr:iron-containing redox enzyme family protein [Gordonia hankookensis]MBD1322500.1 iron-containing redox enzyme family protein [Gordonia hankookensis]